MLFAQVLAPPTTPTATSSAQSAAEVRESPDTRTTRGEGETRTRVIVLKGGCG